MLLVEQMENESYSIPTHVSAECRELIMSMLQPDPIRRPTLLQILDNPWVKVCKRMPCSSSLERC